VIGYNSVRTTCPFCGIGCNFFLEALDGKLIGLRPDQEHPVSKGQLCVKGWNAHEFVRSEDRLTTPLIREGDSFREASWDEALNLIVERFKAAMAQGGGKSVSVTASAKLTNEENYLLNKFARAVLDTNNIDHCARL